MQCLLCKKNIPDNTDVCPYCELPNFMFMYPNLIDVDDGERQRIDGIIKRYYEKSNKGSEKTGSVNTDKKQTSTSYNTKKQTARPSGNNTGTKTIRTGNTAGGYVKQTSTRNRGSTDVTTKTENNMFPAFIIIGAIAFFMGLFISDDTGLLLTMAGLLTAIFGLLGRKICSFLGIVGYIMISAGMLGEALSTDQVLSGDLSQILLLGIVIMVIGIVLKSRRK